MNIKKIITKLLGLPYREYNDNGKVTYEEFSSGYWHKRTYNDKGYETYWEDSDGTWYKWKHNDKGNETYFENNDGDKVYRII